MKFEVVIVRPSTGSRTLFKTELSEYIPSGPYRMGAIKGTIARFFGHTWKLATYTRIVEPPKFRANDIK